MLIIILKTTLSLMLKRILILSIILHTIIVKMIVLLKRRNKYIVKVMM